MSKVRPRRLNETAEFGPYLRSLDESSMSSERLAHNATEVRSRIAVGAGSAVGVSAWLKILLPLLVGAVALYALQLRGGAVEPPVTSPPTPTLPPLMPMPSPTPERVTTTEAPPAQHPQPFSRQRSEPAQAPAAEPAAPESDLPHQLRLYEEAKKVAQGGAYANALERLDELTSLYPTSPLRAEVKLSRLDWLIRAEHLKEALSLANQLVQHPAHRGRRAELWRVIGDLHRRGGQCKEAISAYQRALEFDPPRHEGAAARRGLRRCRGG